MDNPRTRSRVYAVVAGLTLTAIAGMLILLSTRGWSRRIDVTLTRVHQLAPRTEKLLARLDRPATLAIAADLSQMDPAARQGLADVLDKLGRAGPNGQMLTTRLMHTGTQAGMAEYDTLMGELASREKGAIDARLAELQAHATEAEALAGAASVAAGALEKARDGILASFQAAGQTQWDALVGTVRVAETDLRQGASNARAALGRPAAPLAVPALDEARSMLLIGTSALNDALTRAGTLSEQISRAEGAKAELRTQTRQAAAAIAPLRDRAGRLATALSSMEMPRALMVARAVERSRAALLIAEPRQAGQPLDVVGIEPDALLGPAEGGDIRARAEDLVAGALANLTTTVRPRVVLIHNVGSRLAQRDWQPLSLAVRRLSSRGIDVAEWPVALQREMPSEFANADVTQPTVFVTLWLPQADVQREAAALPAFLAALKSIVESGRPLLLNLSPSTIPMLGSPDPVAECLAPTGVFADTGRMVLEEGKVGQRRTVSPYQDFVTPGAAADSAIAATLRGLRLRASFPVAIDASKASSGVTVQPILTVAAREGVWLETEWSEFARAVGQLRGEFVQIENAPKFDAGGRDGRGGEGGSIAIASAISRSVRSEAGGGAGVTEQRLVVAGFNAWFLDGITTQRAEVDGRVATLYPGNMQLLESSVQWLAGQDDQLVRTASAQAAPTIPPLSDGQLGLLRWGLAGGLPVLVLVAGVLWRVWRG